MTDERQKRGMEIAAILNVAKRDDGTWIVPSMNGNGRYVVQPGRHCTCPDHEHRANKCKHMYAVEFAMKRETTQNADGSTTVTETVAIKATKRTTYTQDWPAYNEAQTNEKRHFQSLLHSLCKNVQNPPQGNGRPRLALADAIFCVTFKIYSTVSGRRFMTDLSEAKEKGYIDHTPHFNSIFNYLENPDLTPILTDLITTASLPLKSVECDFAIDSTGFTTSRFVRWYDHKYNAIRQEHDWVKAHLVCGVKTNIVTAVEIHDRDASDTKQLPSLLETTDRNGWSMREVSADKGYSSIANHEKVASFGAVPFISFKSNSTGTDREASSTWSKMFHYFSFKREEFLDHYHKRSNVESTVNMIKAKFRDHVCSKTDVAMKNEVLCKFLCHNICCLISAMYELGIEPVFEGMIGCTKTTPPAQNVC